MNLPLKACERARIYAVNRPPTETFIHHRCIRTYHPGPFLRLVILQFLDQSSTNPIPIQDPSTVHLFGVSDSGGSLTGSDSNKPSLFPWNSQLLRPSLALEKGCPFSVYFSSGSLNEFCCYRATLIFHLCLWLPRPYWPFVACGRRASQRGSSVHASYTQRLSHFLRPCRKVYQSNVLSSPSFPLHFDSSRRTLRGPFIL